MSQPTVLGVGALSLRGSSPAFLAGKKVSEQEFRQPHHNHLTSINVDIERPDDGNVLIARELSDDLPAKICWGILVDIGLVHCIAVSVFSCTVSEEC
jgi:hypothetical protein